MLSQFDDAQDIASHDASANVPALVEQLGTTLLGEPALRLITCGSVDDGKSTLIGRLLWDTKSVSSDHADGLAMSTLRTETGETITDIPEFALLLDGLQAEREQGITIDVAYRYFSTPQRSFIVADTPGHEQYTRNMATGCSTADLAIVLVDARTGILEQTRRHATIATLMGIRQLVLVVNKMDLVGYRQSVFEAIRQDFGELAKSLGTSRVTAIPVSALRGHNVVFGPNTEMPWYQGPALLQVIESAPSGGSAGSSSAEPRFPVQRVSRPDESFRGYQGTISGGQLSVGQELKVWPGGANARIKQIHTFDQDQQTASAGEAVTLVLDRNIDIARGDMLTEPQSSLRVGRTFEANIVALAQGGLQSNKSYWLKTSSRRLRVTLSVESQLNLQTNEWFGSDHLPVNGIGQVSLSFAEEAYFDAYEDNKTTGSFILIDPQTNNTIAAGMVTRQSAGREGYNEPGTTSLTQLTLPTELARKLLASDLAADYRDQIRTRLLPVPETDGDGD